MSLISIGKAAEMLGVHTDTLRGWEKQGKIRSVRTKGNHRRYDTLHIKCRMMSDFWKELSLCPDGCKQWYDFYRKSPEGVFSYAHKYAKKHITHEVDRLRFIVVALQCGFDPPVQPWMKS